MFPLNKIEIFCIYKIRFGISPSLPRDKIRTSRLGIQKRFTSSIIGSVPKELAKRKQHYSAVRSTFIPFCYLFFTVQAVLQRKYEKHFLLVCRQRSRATLSYHVVKDTLLDDLPTLAIPSYTCIQGSNRYSSRSHTQRLLFSCLSYPYNPLSF